MDQANIQREERRGVWGWVIRHPKTMIALVLLLMALLTVLAFQRVAENGLARRIAAIKAKGEPTTVEDLLARQRHIPEHKNMLLALIKPAEKMVKANVPEDKSAHLPYVGVSHRIPTGQRWSEDELDAADWYLQQFAAELISIHTGLKLTDSVYNVAWKSPAMAAAMPEIILLRHTGKVLALEILSAANGANQTASEQLVLETLPMLRVLEGGESLICALVQIALQAIVLDCVERTINMVGLSDSALMRIEVSLREIEHRPNWSTALRAERAIFLDSHAWLRSRSAGGSFWLSLKSVPVLTAMDLTEGLDLHSTLIDAVEAPHELVFQKLAALEIRTKSLPQYYVLPRILMPGFSRAVALWLRNIGQSRSLRAAVACERFRLANGRWPDRLDQLIPAYLDSVPSDPLDGKQIRYSIIPEGIKSWTISGDDHNEDNGGDVQRLEPYREPAKRPMDYGWVILNPELRGRPAAEQKPPDKKSTATTLPAKE